MAGFTYSAGRRVPVDNGPGGLGLLGSAYAGASNNGGFTWSAGRRVRYDPSTMAGQANQSSGNNAARAGGMFNPDLAANADNIMRGNAGNQAMAGNAVAGRNTNGMAWGGQTVPWDQYSGNGGQYGDSMSQYGGGQSSQNQNGAYTMQSPWIPYQPPANNVYQRTAPSLAEMGNYGALRMGGINLAQGLAAPQNIANQINNGFDQQQFYMDRAADRDLKMGIVNKLMQGLGGLNFSGGSGGGMRGFVDMNSGQAAALPGQTTNAITAQALSPQAIAQAAQQARGTGTVAPPTSQPMTGAQRSEVSQIASDAARSAGSANANAIDRGLTGQNAQLQRGIELAKSKQGIGNASWLTNLNQDNANNQIASQAPIIRMLMSALGGGLQGAMNQLS